MSADPEVITKLDMLILMMQGVLHEERAQVDRLARLEGKFEVMLGFFQSTSQRCDALMAPVVRVKIPAG